MAKAETGGSDLPLKEIGIIVAVVLAVAILIAVVVHTERQYQPQVVRSLNLPVGSGAKGAYIMAHKAGKGAQGEFKMPAGGLAAGIDPTR